MLGEKPQTFFTVKDLPAKDFIEAFAQYLKKNNFIERPAWVDLVKTGTSIHINIQDNNTHLLKRTGSTLESLPSLEKSTSVLTPESDSSLTSTEDSWEENAKVRDTSTPQQKLSDGDSSNWRSSNWSRKTRREIIWSLTPASFLLRVAESWTELLLSTLRTRNDVIYRFKLPIYQLKIITYVTILVSLFSKLTILSKFDQSDSWISFRVFALSIFFVLRGLRLCEVFIGDPPLPGIIQRNDLYLSSLKNWAILLSCSSLRDLSLWNS